MQLHRIAGKYQRQASIGMNNDAFPTFPPAVYSSTYEVIKPRHIITIVPSSTSTQYYIKSQPDVITGPGPSSRPLSDYATTTSMYLYIALVAIVVQVHLPVALIQQVFLFHPDSCCCPTSVDDPAQTEQNPKALPPYGYH